MAMAACAAPPPPLDVFGTLQQQVRMDKQVRGSNLSDISIPQSDDSFVKEMQPLRETSSTSKDESTAMDFTKVPSSLDTKFEKLDTDSALRPTVIHVGEEWQKKSLKSLRGKPVEKSLWSKEQDEEKTRCYDCFDESIVNTIVQNNINPIEKVERSLLIVGSTIQGKPPGQLVKPTNLAQIGGHSPQLLNENEEAMEQ